MLTAYNRRDEVDDGKEADEEHSGNLEEDRMQGLHAESARICFDGVSRSSDTF